MYRGALVSGFANICSTLTNQQIIFKPLDRFFQKFEILEILKINRPLNNFL